MVAQKLSFLAQQRHQLYNDAKHAPAVFAVNDEVLLFTAGLQLNLCEAKASMLAVVPLIIKQPGASSPQALS